MSKTLALSSLQTIQKCFASCSIGCKPSDTLPKRIEALSSAGFEGIELAMPNLMAFASEILGHDVGPYDYDDLCAAAIEVKKLCASKKMTILVLQPFSNFEGWTEGSEEREDAFRRAKGWIRIMRACGTDLLQVGSSDSPASKIGTDRNRFVSDLQELAGLLAEHNLRLAYENWCWSSHAPGWRDVWDIVQKVGRSNVGLCLDTFQTAGGEWADPTTESGLIEDVSRDELEKTFNKSLEDLSATIPADKIFFLQISDAYKVDPPFSKEPDESGTMPRGRWSHDFRPLPYNGGYLPVVEVARAVLRTGFRGWLSMEVFDGGKDGKGKDYDIQAFATVGLQSYIKMLEAVAEEYHALQENPVAE
ncbi:xylose isomerase-like protein [Aulographum hederae CBS 113979]|uniref:Xylose isomerase-like protein n=1 Tax=Aulographum hederae CBS 113979 TaxID=1176131 RepID=A0A6G1H3V4_9PEZI|nr:xylose isomerase-like protein [Aulographum hederae CBS 113979]